MTYNRVIIPIVEGDGDEEAAPGLLRRILDEEFGRPDILALKPINAKGKPRLLNKVEKLVKLAEQKSCHGILIIIDADEECPFLRAKCIVNRVLSIHVQVPVAIVYARAEYETWFICSLSKSSGEGIREVLEIPDTINAPENVEAIRSAKGWLDRNMPQDKAYKEKPHQRQLTRYIDFKITYSRSRSFRRLYHAIEELVDAIDRGAPTVSPTN